MKVLIVSGFLGAGKTTFIKELIRRSNRQLVILENEYGSTDVDLQVLESDGGTDVWDLTEGCVCCTKSEDLNASVVTIESTLEPEVLVVEPSGVGALSNVIRNLRRIEYERIQILRPLTVVDADHFTRYSREFTDVYQDQIRASGTVMISKPEMPDPALYARVVEEVKKLNPEAEVLPMHYSRMPQDWWDSILQTTYDGKRLAEVDETGLDLETCTVESCRAASPASLLWILQQAVRGRFGEIVRAKGVLPAGKDWVRFDITGGTLSITGFVNSTGEKAECVWIGRALDRMALRGFLMDSDYAYIDRKSAGAAKASRNTSGTKKPGLKKF